MWPRASPRGIAKGLPLFKNLFGARPPPSPLDWRDRKIRKNSSHLSASCGLLTAGLCSCTPGWETGVRVDVGVTGPRAAASIRAGPSLHTQDWKEAFPPEQTGGSSGPRRATKAQPVAIAFRPQAGSPGGIAPPGSAAHSPPLRWASPWPSVAISAAVFI